MITSARIPVCLIATTLYSSFCLLFGPLTLTTMITAANGSFATHHDFHCREPKPYHYRHALPLPCSTLLLAAGFLPSPPPRLLLSLTPPTSPQGSPTTTNRPASPPQGRTELPPPLILQRRPSSPSANSDSNWDL